MPPARLPPAPPSAPASRAQGRMPAAAGGLPCTAQQRCWSQAWPTGRAGGRWGRGTLFPALPRGGEDQLGLMPNSVLGLRRRAWGWPASPGLAQPPGLLANGFRWPRPQPRCEAALLGRAPGPPRRGSGFAGSGAGEISAVRPCALLGGRSLLPASTGAGPAACGQLQALSLSSPEGLSFPQFQAKEPRCGLHLGPLHPLGHLSPPSPALHPKEGQPQHWGPFPSPAWRFPAALTLACSLLCSGIGYPLFSHGNLNRALATRTSPPLYLGAEGRRADVHTSLSSTRSNLTAAVSAGHSLESWHVGTGISRCCGSPMETRGWGGLGGRGLGRIEGGDVR